MPFPGPPTEKDRPPPSNNWSTAVGYISSECHETERKPMPSCVNGILSALLDGDSAISCSAQPPTYYNKSVLFGVVFGSAGKPWQGWFGLAVPRHWEQRQRIVPPAQQDRHDPYQCRQERCGFQQTFVCETRARWLSRRPSKNE